MLKPMREIFFLVSVVFSANCLAQSFNFQASSNKDRETLAREADEKRALEAKKREELQRGFSSASPNQSPVQKSQPQPVQNGFSGDPLDRLTTYASIVGRGMACNVPSAPKRAAQVGAWLKREGLSQQYGGIYLQSIKIAVEQQKNGKTPDSCQKISSVFDSFPWP